MRENSKTAPVLIPLQPEEFWDKIRLIIRQEIINLENKTNEEKNAAPVHGLKYKPLYKMVEVCQLFGVTRQTIYDWIKHGKLKPYKVRSRIYFLHNDIIQLLPI